MICDEEHIQPEDPKINAMAALFRDFWMCAVTYMMEANGSWPTKWSAILRRIATKTPALAFAQQERCLEADLRAHSVLEQSFPEEVSTHSENNI